MATVAVLGAGFGGIPAALELKRLRPKDRVVLVDKRDTFHMGLAQLWLLDGRRPLVGGTRKLDALKAKGLEVVRGAIETIDAKAKTVKVNGTALAYDKLLLALGADLAPGAIPGFETAHNFYAADGAAKLGQALATFRGGPILVAIAGPPYKCPAAPYEAAMLIGAHLRRRGVKATIEVTTPEPRPLPVLPAWCGGDVTKWLAERGIRYSPEHKVKAVHASDRVVEYENGVKKSYDLLAGVPLHKAPDVIKGSGLGDGWVAVDRTTLKTPFEHVYAIGDCAGTKLPGDQKLLPRAGVLAESAGLVAARNIAAELDGRTVETKFDGKGACWVEVGDGLATQIQAEFFATPEPKVTIAEPSAEALGAKERFESDRLRAWFGA